MSDITQNTSGGNHKSENPPAIAVAAGAGILRAPSIIPNSANTANENPFANLAKLSRSPPPVSNLPPQYKPEVPQTPQNETIASHVNETAAIDPAIVNLQSFEKLCATLQKQVEDLKIENQKLKNSLKSLSNQMEMEVSAQTEFHTDEEELDRELNQETKWIVQRKKSKPTKLGKRKADKFSSEMETPVKFLKLDNVRPKELAKKPKLPPVILSNISDFNQVKEVMSSQNIKHEFKLLNNNQLSIKVNCEDDYRTLTKALNEAKFEWHSYENKATRPCKVIARGLHHTCKPEYIVEDLKASGFNVLSVINLMKKKKVNDKQIKDPLPLFMLTFHNSEDIKKVFSITHIVHTKVKIEAIRKQRDQIPQCKKCQRFEHTQSFCNREPRCVKCAGSHLTIKCTQDRTAPPKCSNCDEAHPANYRGCVVAKELQKRRSAKKKSEVPKTNPRVATTNVVKGMSYSDIVRKDVVRKDTPKSASNQSPFTKKVNHQQGQSSSKKSISMYQSILQTLAQMNARFDEFSARLDKSETHYAHPHTQAPRRTLKK